MKAWKPEEAWALIQSLNMKPSMPQVISRRRRIARNMAYAANKAVFSLRAPTQPTNAAEFEYNNLVFGSQFCYQ